MIIINHIFRKYDIRGIVDQELTEGLMADIARAFAAAAIESGEKNILVGRDNRESSPRLAAIVIKALQESGCRVIDLGMVVTPMLYFAARSMKIKAGIMITASHNPPEYNGCKLFLGESTIYGDDIQQIKRMIEKRHFIYGNGSYESMDIFDEYLSYITSQIKLGPRPLKIVVDCGNGTASVFAPTLYKRLGCEVIELYCDSDPRFPNHHPDPVDPENMEDLVARVKSEQADIGIGLDGDGDRIGVVDSQGQLVWGDMLMILFWRDILPRYPGAKAIVEVKCSQSLIDEIKRLGGEPIMYKTGHSLIKAKMKDIGAVFTGEMSGHMFFADEYYGYDDGLYAGARLLSLLSFSSNSLADMLSDVPRYYSTPEIRLKTTDDKKFELVERVSAHYGDKYKIIDIDGARIIFPDGWGLVRASNTGPELIVRCEGSSAEALERITDDLFSYLNSLGLKDKSLHRKIMPKV